MVTSNRCNHGDRHSRHSCHGHSKQSWSQALEAVMVTGTRSSRDKKVTCVLRPVNEHDYIRANSHGHRLLRHSWSQALEAVMVTGTHRQSRQSWSQALEAVVVTGTRSSHGHKLSKQSWSQALSWHSKLDRPKPAPLLLGRRTRQTKSNTITSCRVVLVCRF